MAKGLSFRCKKRRVVKEVVKGDVKDVVKKDESKRPEKRRWKRRPVVIKSKRRCKINKTHTFFWPVLSNIYIKTIFVFYARLIFEEAVHVSRKGSLCASPQKVRVSTKVPFGAEKLSASAEQHRQLLYTCTYRCGCAVRRRRLVRHNMYVK